MAATLTPLLFQAIEDEAGSEEVRGFRHYCNGGQAIPLRSTSRIESLTPKKI